MLTQSLLLTFDRFRTFFGAEVKAAFEEVFAAFALDGGAEDSEDGAREARVRAEASMLKRGDRERITE